MHGNETLSQKSLSAETCSPKHTCDDVLLGVCKQEGFASMSVHVDHASYAEGATP